MALAFTRSFASGPSSPTQLLEYLFGLLLGLGLGRSGMSWVEPKCRPLEFHNLFKPQHGGVIFVYDSNKTNEKVKK